MTEQEIQEQAEKMYPEYPTEPKGETRYNKGINCFKKRKAFVHGAKWMQEQDGLKYVPYQRCPVCDNDGRILQDGLDTRCEPIPLTEEWLIKLGYAQDVDTPFFKINMPRNIGYIHYNPNNQITWLKHHNSDSALNPQSLFYVHQLQNLYFTLTGEELEFKLF